MLPLHCAAPLLALCCLQQTSAAPAAAAAPAMKPLLFMEPRDIVSRVMQPRVRHVFKCG